MEPSEYCREIETYLCRKNDGHLIRIVGPAFEQVCGWATLGVPLKVAFRGIDQYCGRYYAKGLRRRPVRIEFCEPDILDLFDAWRRATGVTASGGALVADEPAARKPSLASHIERALVKLTTVGAGNSRSAPFAETIDALVRQLDRLSSDARGARGESRSTIVARLQSLDDALLGAAAREADAVLTDALEREAQEELAPFAPRMPEAALDRARAAAFQRLLREAFGLPTLTFD